MKSWKLGLLVGAVLMVMGVSMLGCGGGGGGDPVPAKGLNATGFWENPLNGLTAAGFMTQKVANVTGYLLLPPGGTGYFTGTVDGYHMKFTMAWDSGRSESGEGDFAYVTDSAIDKLTFTGSMGSVGPFVISWRGADSSPENHSPGGEPLSFDPPASTW